MVDKVEIKNVEENPTLEEQDKALQEAQKAPSEKPSETSETRPEWLPEKFADSKELAKAYGELEKKLSSREEDKSYENEKSTTDQLKINKEKVEEATGLGLDNYYSEYEKNGTLSEKSYKDLAGKGLDKTLVDSYISGQQALADKHVGTIHSVVGGKEKYDTIVKWASDNLADNEVKAFNDTMDNGTLDQAQLAISGIQAKYNSVNQEPSLFSGERADTSKGAYRSVGEMLTDINNPKYSTDSAFRADVEAKVKASNVL